MEEEKKKTAREIIENYDGPKVRIMEVCGTHTHEIFRLGIRKLLPPQVELISGPGCPVCVTPVRVLLRSNLACTGKRRNDLYVWRSGACTGNEDEPWQEQGKKEQNPYRIFSGDAEKYASDIRGSRWFFFRWALKRPLRQSVFL